MSLFAGLGVFSRMPSTFQFLGLDFMVTRDFHVWFIEANNYPLWPKGTPFIDDLMKTLGVSMRVPSPLSVLMKTQGVIMRV